MGISNVNNLKNIDLSKLSLLQKSKGAQSSKPEYMKMTGSIFNAPQVKGQSSQTTNLTTLNTNRSFAELRGPKNTSTTSLPESKKEQDNDTNIDQGSVQKQGDKVKSYTKTAEKDTQKVTKFQTESQELDKKTKDSDKKFKAQMKRDQAEFQKNNTLLNKLVEKNIEVQKQIENDQKELDSLLGSSSFTMSTGSAQGSQGGSYVNPNQDKINELQARIGTNTNLIQGNGRAIYSLQRSSTRAMTRMNKTNANYIKTNKHNAKTIQQNQNETSKAVKIATKIEQYSALAEQGGKMLDLTGQGLVTAGQALASSLNPVTAAIGSAMIATGTVMSKIGTVVEMVGQYGQVAANVTKTAAYAAEGNLMGAMQSCAAAVQSGAAAVKSTKNLKGTFGQIDQRAQEATKKATANQVAKQEVKNMKATAEKAHKTADFGGLSEKEYRKNLSKKLQATEFGEKDANITGNWSRKQAEQYKEQMTAKLGEAKGEVTKEYNSNLLKNAGLEDQYTINDNGKIINKTTKQEISTKDLIAEKSKDNAKGFKKVLKNTSKQTNATFANAATKAKRSTQKFDFQKFSQGIMSTAALFNAQNTGNTQGTSGSAPQWNLDADPKMRRIRKSRTATMRHASYV